MTGPSGPKEGSMADFKLKYLACGIDYSNVPLFHISTLFVKDGTSKFESHHLYIEDFVGDTKEEFADSLQQLAEKLRKA